MDTKEKRGDISLRDGTEVCPYSAAHRRTERCPRMRRLLGRRAVIVDGFVAHPDEYPCRPQIF